MNRVHVICEGQTEEMFVKEVLYQHFFKMDMVLIPTLIGKPGRKGGYFKFDRLYENLEIRLLGDLSSYCTIFFDFYGLPNDFPGKNLVTSGMTIDQKAHCIKFQLVDELKKKLGSDPLSRFVPYIQMFEFEGLLFSDPQVFSRSVSEPSLQAKIMEIRNQFESPEHINDSPEDAPSKRILKHFPAYEKPFHGNLAAIDMGIDVLRRECRLFDQWVSALEALAREKRP
ncbi:MAG: DUF4276 family protein [Planctomycetota bacterium]